MVEYTVAIGVTRVRFSADACFTLTEWNAVRVECSRSAVCNYTIVICELAVISIGGLVVEYIVAIDVTWARFPADAGFTLTEWNAVRSGV